MTAGLLRRSAPMPPPLFIVGHWRSGTTHLYNVLSRSPAFGYVPPIATGLPWDMLGLARLLRPLLERALPPERFVDSLPVRPELAAGGRDRPRQHAAPVVLSRDLLPAPARGALPARGLLRGLRTGSDRALAPAPRAVPAKARPAPAGAAPADQEPGLQRAHRAAARDLAGGQVPPRLPRSLSGLRLHAQLLSQAAAGVRAAAVRASFGSTSWSSMPIPA